MHPLDAYFAADATADQLVPVDAFSRGAVTRMDTLWRDAAVAGGFFDPDIFGPLDGSQLQWGHVDVPSGIVIAGARVTQIPVPPIAQRMPTVVDDPAARVRWHGPLNAAWIDLLGAIRLHDRLAGLGAPEGFVANQAVHAQRHFEDIVALMRGERPAQHHHAGTTATDHYLMMPCPPYDDAQPLALVFLDDDRLLVQTTIGCQIVDRKGVAVARGWSPTGPFASSVHGDLVVFNAGQRSAWRGACYADSAWPDDAPRSLPLAAYDLANEKWLMLADERLPRWAIDETDVRDADVLDLRTDEVHALSAPGLDARQITQSRDGRFVLARIAKLSMFEDDEGSDGDDADDDADADVAGDDPIVHNDAVDMVHAIIEIATRRPFLELAEAGVDLPSVELSAVRTPHPFTPPPAAIAFAAATGWRIVDTSGAVGDGERWWYRLQGAQVTAWSPTGAQLAAIVGDELVILDITPMGAQIASRARIG